MTGSATRGRLPREIHGARDHSLGGARKKRPWLTLAPRQPVSVPLVVADDVMTRDPAVCEEGLLLGAVAELLHTRACREVFVVNNLTERKPVGVVTEWDVLRCCFAHGPHALGKHVSDVMSTPLVAVLEDTPLGECESVMNENGVRRVPVIEANGGLCGMVCRSDVTRDEPSEDSTSQLTSSLHSAVMRVREWLSASA